MAHKIPEIAYQMQKTSTPYQDSRRRLCTLEYIGLQVQIVPRQVANA